MIMSGKAVRDELKKALALRMSALKGKGVEPTLAIVQAGDRPDTAAYVAAKKKFGAEIGAEVRHIHLDEDVSQEEIIERVKGLNADDSVQGIIVQLPLPAHLERDEIIYAIDPSKDADGLTASSVAKWSAGDPDAIWPATARGVGELLDFYDVGLSGKNVCVVGRSALVGTPIAALCRARGAEVAVCHSRTPDMKKETLAADVIIVAVGKPKLLSVADVKPGQAVVDVGINEVSGSKLDEEIPKRKLVGDVDFEAVKAAIGDSGAITPVPGGVGPMTVLALFENLADLCDKE